MLIRAFLLNLEADFDKGLEGEGYNGLVTDSDGLDKAVRLPGALGLAHDTACIERFEAMDAWDHMRGAGIRRMITEAREKMK